MKTLFMDTSASTMRVCLMEEGRIVQEEIQQGAKNHSTLLMPAIANVMARQQWQPNDLDEIMVAKGPGSYTGVRMGVTTAKTLAWTLQRPLCLVSSLEVLASQVDAGDYIIPVIDARRHHVYGALYQRVGDMLEPVIADGYYEFDALLSQVIHTVSPSESIVITGELAAFSDEIQANYPTIKMQDDTTSLIGLSHLQREVIQGEAIHHVVPSYLKKVEAEEKWEAQHEITDEERQSFVEKTK